MKAVIPGSFDPFTLGHLDIVTRASRIFDQVVVAVGVNQSKQGLAPLDVRLEMVRQAVEGLANVEVAVYEGLLVDFCRTQGATVVVRGARSGADFEYEYAMAGMNSSLGNVDTVILPASPSVCFITSALVRSVDRAGGDASAFLPANTVMSMKKEL